MHKLTTVISEDTLRKMREIARMMGLNSRRFYKDVIEKAVDVLYEYLSAKQS